ncbi:30S ribosomal protein S6 [Sphingomonas flavalba]|uniref:30S ribosomal protein S6 n=1 Tax=Sphingomonas flavalba TaxID=2559804 RepID=UPI00109DE605|nr:30S ribosomal protein S6 [Sphingomonas flavalba]
MALYEHVFLARQDLAQAQVDALAEAATKIVEDNAGKVLKVETWGLRGLAYRIARNRKAHYVMLDIDAPAGVVAELERQTAINEDVIRYMTIRVDAHEAGPSVMMRKSDRDSRRGDRGDRGDRPRRDRDDA